MNKLFTIKYFIVVLIGLIMISCAPSQTVKQTEPSISNEERKLQAEQEYSIAYEYFKQAKYDDAILHFKESIKFNPKYYAAYIALAKVYRAKRDIVAAESTYIQAKKINPGDTRAYEGIATIYFADYKNYDQAIIEFNNGLKADSTKVDLLNGLAACYTKKKQYDIALKYYNKSLVFDPENVETMFAVAKVYIERNEPDKAIKYLKDLKIKKPKNIDVRKKLVETLIDLKRYSEAAEELQYLLEKEPDNYYYHLQLGSIYQQQKKYKNAEAEFNKARELEPNKALPLFHLADLNIRRGKYGAAENLVKEAQKIEPNNFYNYILLGDIYERRGYAQKIAWDKNKCKKNCPKLKTALSYLRTAISYYNKGKGDGKYSSYASTEVSRCSKWIKALEEDKWFYCK